LEKAKRDPESTKARILKVARKVFGEYGYHGGTTRMIAEEVGIDLSTIHYHWGEKKDLYEAVILDINNDLGLMLQRVEREAHGKPLDRRMEIAFDMMADYLFDHPEVSNLILLNYFSKTRIDSGLDVAVPEFTSDIARSMGLTKGKKHASPRAMLEVMIVMNAVHGVISGENFFLKTVKIDRDAYIDLVKKTLSFVLIPGFAAREEEEKARERARLSPDH
jgi:AcrR family transcriptional regulator